MYLCQGSLEQPDPLVSSPSSLASSYVDIGKAEVLFVCSRTAENGREDWARGWV